jgi:putative aminopeptidase FrvX
MPEQIFTEDAHAFLRRYLNNASPTSFEESGQRLWLDYIKPFIHTWEQDAYGTCYGIINPGSDYRVVIEAHADEISWYVNYITDEGFIYLNRNGGSDPMIAPSMRVWIHTDQGAVRGVFGWPAIHTREAGKEPVTNLENIFIDIGAKNKQEVLDKGIHIGCVVTFDADMELLNDRFVMGRALDNRIGGFCIAQVARLLHENKIELPFSLYIVNSVQEEIGLRGAEMIARNIKPDVAIITDVTHDAYTPLLSAKKEGDVKAGNGPSLTHAPAVHRKLLKLIMDTAAAQNISFQRETASRSTGTDTDAFAYAGAGTPSALISLPLRYMHTTVEMADMADIESVTSLIYHSLQAISYRHNFYYL